MQARHVQLGLLFGCRLVQTMMRLALGPIVVYVCEDEAMECTASTRASLLSAFSLGYILTQVGLQAGHSRMSSARPMSSCSR